MLSISRRQALLGILAAGLNGTAVASQLAAATDTVDTRTLAAYLDVLLPEDEYSPAASALGVEAEVVDLASKSPLFERLLSLGTQWLNQTGQGPFYNLTLSDQQRVVDWMAAADRNQIPGRFYQLVRLTAVEFYYARPEAIAGMDLNTSPQPAGHLPPWQ